MPKLILLPLALLVQQDPAEPPDVAGLVTDRPYSAASPTVVPRGAVQLETGATWEQSEGRSTLSGPEALGRWGVHERLELRLALPDFVSTTGTPGLTDAGVGAKLALGSLADWDFAVVGNVSVPTGDDRFGRSGTEGTVILAVGTRDGNFSLGTQVAGTWSSESGRGPLEYAQVFGVGLGDRAATFFEVALTSTVADTGDDLRVHHGYTFLLAPTLQFDVHGGLGLPRARVDDLVVGFGLSLRTRR